MVDGSFMRLFDLSMNRTDKCDLMTTPRVETEKWLAGVHRYLANKFGSNWWSSSKFGAKIHF